jgi:uncharacterized protein involved in response to NO
MPGTATSSIRFAVLRGGFRPFFLLAGLDAVFNMVVWLAAYRHPDIWPPGAIAPVYWHAHEMMFGFIAAAIGGFLLTAVPNWTDRPPYAGIPLAALAAVWLAGRIAMAATGDLSPVVVAIVDLAFFPALVLALAPPLLRAGRWRNLPFVPLLTFLFLADLVFHLGNLEAVAGGQMIGLGLALDIVAILIVVIGGRIIPAFTRNGLMQYGVSIAIRQRAWLDNAAIASIVAVLLGDILFPQSPVNGAIALAAAAIQAARLAQWHGHRTARDPLIWVLHAGYAWLVLALFLKGIWLVAGATFATKWIHAFTAGAFATMILAVTTRASLGHTGRALKAPRLIAIAYLLVTLAALVRVFGGTLFPGFYDGIILAAGLIWIGAFGLFVLVYAPMLLSPRLDGKAG